MSSIQNTEDVQCTDDNADGIVTIGPCICGAAGTAHPGDYCNVSADLIIYKCIDDVFVCEAYGSDCTVAFSCMCGVDTLSH